MARRHRNPRWTTVRIYCEVWFTLPRTRASPFNVSAALSLSLSPFALVPIRTKKRDYCLPRCSARGLHCTRSCDTTMILHSTVSLAEARSIRFAWPANRLECHFKAFSRLRILIRKSNNWLENATPKNRN